MSPNYYRNALECKERFQQNLYHCMEVEPYSTFSSCARHCSKTEVAVFNVYKGPPCIYKRSKYIFICLAYKLMLLFTQRHSIVKVLIKLVMFRY